MTPNRKNNTINYKKESKFGPWTQEEREAGRRRKDLKRVTSMTTMELLKKARGAKGALALADTELKNRALMEMARPWRTARRTFWPPMSRTWRRPVGPSPR